MTCHVLHHEIQTSDVEETPTVAVLDMTEEAALRTILMTEVHKYCESLNDEAQARAVLERYQDEIVTALKQIEEKKTLTLRHPMGMMIVLLKLNNGYKVMIDDMGMFYVGDFSFSKRIE